MFRENSAMAVVVETLRIVKHSARRGETFEEALRQVNEYLATKDVDPVSDGIAYDGLKEEYERYHESHLSSKA